MMPAGLNHSASHSSMPEQRAVEVKEQKTRVLGARARTSWEQFLDLLFPPRCVGCRRGGAALCAECLGQIKLIASPVCSRCGHALFYADADCNDCRHYPFTITSIHSAVWHDGPIREAIHALKYNRRRDVISPLVGLMQARLEDLSINTDLVVSVPLHPDRERERGYNQAHLLAEELARRINRPYSEALERVRATQDQIGLDGAARRKNVRAAFRTRDATVRGARIMLVDDVCTTGATLDACAIALFENGARAVHGLTVTRPR